MWQAKGREVDAAFLGTLKPEKVLFEYEGPRSFFARDATGQLLFAHQCGESEAAWRYAIVPFSASLASLLEAGQLDLRSALHQPRLWVVDVGPHWEILRCTIESTEAIPENCLPQVGAMIYPEHEPLLSVRSTGRDVELRTATLGLLTTALDNVRAALKALAEFATGAIARRGQPSAATRRYYDLPAVLLPGSIQVTVLPRDPLQRTLFDSDEVWRRMESTLERGFAEARSLNESNATIDDELRAALHAVYLLAPPASGPIEGTEVSGRLTEKIQPFGSPIHITRRMRSSIRKRLKRDTENALDWIQEEGFISELDRVEATCLLRDGAGNTIRKLSFEDEFFDEIKEAFDTQRKVRVVAQIFHPATIADLLGILPDE